MDTSSDDGRRRRHDDRHNQEKALVRVFDLSGGDITVVQYHCLIAERSRNTLKLISDEPLPVGERVDITVDLGGSTGSKTFSGIPRSLAVAYESSGFLVDVELIGDRHVAAWQRQFH